MKILSIKITNLASLDGEHIIEFENGVLKDAPLFSIVGDTGSGKSTILDAICLALYGRSPRYSDGKETLKFFGGEDEKGKDFCSNTASTKTVNIITKGRKEGSAECIFELTGGIRYCALWSCRLKNDMLGMANKGVLHTYSKIVLNGGKELVSEPIDMKEHKAESIIGLSFEQFTRTMLLAQNQFSNFLKADPKEKAHILEAITGTEIYSRTMRKIVDYHNEAKRNKAEVETRIEQMQKVVGEVGEEVAEQMRQKVEEITASLSELDKKKDEFVRQQEWWKQYSDLAKSVQKSKAEYETAQSEYDKVKANEERLQLYDSVSSMKDDFILRDNTKSIINELAQKTKRVEEDIDSEQANYNKISIEKEEYIEDEKQFEKTLAQLSPKIEKAKEQETKLIALQQDSKTISNDLSLLKKKEADARTVYDSALKNHNNAEQTFSNFVSKNSGVDFSISYDFDQLSKRSTQLQSRIVSLKKLLDLLKEGKQLGVKIKASEKEFAEATEASEKMRLFVEAAREKLKFADAELDRKKSFFISVSSKSAESMRATLVDGQPCPVCGSTTHNVHSLKAFTDSILSAKVDVDNAQIQRDMANAELDKATDKHSSAVASCSRIEGLLRSDREKLKELRSRWKENLCEGVNNTITAEELDALISRSEADFECVEADLKKNELKNEYDKLSASVQTQKQLLDNAKNTLDQQTKEYVEKEKDSRVILGQLNETKSAIVSLIGDTTTSDLEKALNANKEKLNNRKSNIENRLTHSKTKIDSLNQNLVAYVEESKIKNFELNEWQRRISERISAYNAEHTPLNEEILVSLFNSKINWSYERTMIEKIKKSFVTSQSAYSQLSLQYENMGNEKPEYDLQKIEEALESIRLKKSEFENEKQSYTSSIDAYERNANELMTLKEQYDEALHNFNNWASLYKCLGNASGDDITMLTQCYTLKFLIREANEQLKLFSKRYTLKQIPNTLVIVVVDSEMGGEERHITSISGGETFIVSLALALGLSNLSRKNTQLYNLFIDEGFGSLDAKELTRVIDALETLQYKQNRKVGVISHTSDMRERIQTQIQVKKLGSGGKSTIEVR